MGASVPEHMPPPPHNGRPRYELLRVVNRGGMGEIALAKAIGTKGFEKLVVLKRLRADAEARGSPGDVRRRTRGDVSD